MKSEYGNKNGGVSGSSVKSGLSKQEKIPHTDKAQDTHGKSQMPTQPSGSVSKGGKNFKVC